MERMGAFIVEMWMRAQLAKADQGRQCICSNSSNHAGLLGLGKLLVQFALMRRRTAKEQDFFAAREDRFQDILLQTTQHKVLSDLVQGSRLGKSTPFLL